MSKFVCPSEDTLLDAIGIVPKMDDGTKRGRFGGYELKHADLYTREHSRRPGKLIKYFIPDSNSFQRITKPGREDWLYNQKEVGQTFHEFATMHHMVPSKSKNTIYLQPFCIEEEHVPSVILAAVQKFCQIFFGMDVKILKPVSFKGMVPQRINPGSKTLQINAKAVLEKLRHILPTDAFCLAGITLCDMFPKDDWNFVFGLASFGTRCGVHSLARYLDNFGSDKNSVFNADIESSILLRRTCKTLCHEIGHMFDLRHCIYFRCLMTGSNNLPELDSKSSFLCPACLRKLHFSCKFKILGRYRKMLDHWSKYGLQAETDWLRDRISFLSGGEDEPRPDSSLMIIDLDPDAI